MIVYDGKGYGIDNIVKVNHDNTFPDNPTGLMRKAMRASRGVRHKPVGTRKRWPMGTAAMPGCIRENIRRGKAVYLPKKD